jgi:hypothetical protein
VTGDREEEPQRVMGIPLGTFSRDPDAEEPQRVLGFPVTWFEPARHELRGFLERHVPGYRRRAQRRRAGRAAPGEDDQRPQG